jgi:pyrroloquinoline quinone biosynthesis protein B
MVGPDTGLTAIVLGSAAGGGVPQWNCRCRVCAQARTGDPRVQPRSQVSIAISGDEKSWLLIGASPDLRQQILATRQLAPQSGLRHSPISGVVLINADVDGIAGLLAIRESEAFRLYAPVQFQQMLKANPIFDVLDPSLVERVSVSPSEPVDCGGGMSLRLLPMPGKVPLYLEDRAAVQPEPGATYAALVEASGRRALVAPACAAITDEVLGHMRQSDVVFFDGTLFTDDEMIHAGVGRKTGRRMGHVSMSGDDGSLARLADLPIRRIFVHINNTNPVLIEGSEERRQVETAGFEVAFDGMEVRL